jgi:4-hydroxy-tetrahydrodipicolinate reductase
MGKVIEQIALDRGHEIAGRITSSNRDELDHIQADVAIEFSRPEAAIDNITWCLKHQIPVACGTTGWLHQLPAIEKLTADCNGTFFYASNFSVGVNIFFKVNEFLARLTQGQDQFDISIDEIHHTEKKDAPSGTAITLAQGIMKHHPEKKRWVNEESDNPDDLFIHSFRIAQVPGTHTVKYSSLIDSIEIRHVAHSREGFARGAVLVAEWLRGKKGLLTMEDFLRF